MSSVACAKWRHGGCWGVLIGWLLVSLAARAQAVTPYQPGRPVAPAAIGRADTLAPVSEELVRYYLARSLSVPVLAAPVASPAQHDELLQWACGAGMRLAGRLGGWWSTPHSDADAQAKFDRLRRNVQQLHALQPTAVAQGCIFEIVELHVNNLTVPNRLRAEFGEDTLAQPVRHFRFADMMYPAYYDPADTHHYRWEGLPPNQAPGVPDLSRREAQLWFYYCAVGQLDAGCEALHFGQIMLMDDRDPGHRATWSLLQRVRRYARTRNRGFVLCDAHTHGEYYDPRPAQLLPDSVRQLLFDFHSFPMRPEECDTLRVGQHGAYLTYDTRDPVGGAIFGRSRGGRAPGGWLCRHLPAQAEFDNGPAGVRGRPGQWPTIWGFDEISWFVNQPPAYRNEWLVYAQARIQQLDPDVYFQPAGARGFTSPDGTNGLYWATTEGQAATIQAIWAGETAAEGQRLVLTGPSLPSPTIGAGPGR